MARTLIYQLYYQESVDWEILHSLYQSCGNGMSQPSLDQLLLALRSMIVLARKVQIVLDALDECSTRRDLLDWIRDIHDLSNVYLLVTSRPELEIKAEIQSLAPKAHIMPLQNELVYTDIYHFVNSTVYNDIGLSRWRDRPEVQWEIKSALINKADGM